MSSHPMVDLVAPVETEFKWIVVDDDWIRPENATRYGSLAEMHTAPLRLSGETAEKFAAAKRRRVARAATPLSLS